jgi:hypothetical protein
MMTHGLANLNKKIEKPHYIGILRGIEDEVGRRERGEEQ